MENCAKTMEGMEPGSRRLRPFGSAMLMRRERAVAESARRSRFLQQDRSVRRAVAGIEAGPFGAVYGWPRRPLGSLCGARLPLRCFGALLHRMMAVNAVPEAGGLKPMPLDGL